MPMTKKPLLLRGQSRREFGKLVLATSAALGLGPTRGLEILSDIYGHAVAQEMFSPNLSLNLMPGPGSCSWFNFIWPLPRLIHTPKANQAYDTPSMAQEVLGAPAGQRQLYVRKYTDGQPLWNAFGAKKHVSIYQVGGTAVHAAVPDYTGNAAILEASATGARVQLYGAQASLQRAFKSILPVIGVDQAGVGAPYAPAPGAPTTASSAVGANGLIALFNSLASTTELSNPTNRLLYSDYFNVLLSLTKTSGHPLYRLAQEDAKSAIRLLGLEYSAQLTPDPTVIETWVANATAPGVRNGVVPLARTLWVAAKAMSLGLASQINVPCFQAASDFFDPHTAFGGSLNTQGCINTLMSVLHNLMLHLDALTLPGTPARKLSDATVITVVGDIPKQPFLPDAGRADWVDTTPGDTNWIWVMSQGRCKPGWFGDMTDVTSKVNFSPATGALTPGFPDGEMRDGAIAAILYATSGGDKRAINNFYTKNYDGLIV